MNVAEYLSAYNNWTFLAQNWRFKTKDEKTFDY